MWFRGHVMGHPVPPGMREPPALETAIFRPTFPPLAGRHVEYSWSPDGDDRILRLRTVDDRSVVNIRATGARSAPVPAFEHLVNAWKELIKTPR